MATLRERLRMAMTEALKAQEKTRLSTLRLINAAIRDRDIARRGTADESPAPEAEIVAILAKLIRQRRESASAYEEGGRLELAEQERAEIALIEEFLPRQLSPEETAAAIRGAIDEAAAATIRDTGRVMAILKAKYPGRIDLAAAGTRVKERLSGGGAPDAREGVKKSVAGGAK